MKILIIHNYYQQPGGEDQVFAAESNLLKRYGHSVLRYTVHNDRVAEMSSFALARDTLWSGETYDELRGLIRRERPQILHAHNTFPLFSPAAYYAARAERVPVVQTLHNYRLFCPNSVCFRDGHACEDCLGKVVPWPGVVHACYRGDRLGTALVASMLTVHRVLRTWTKIVSVYIALSDFARERFIEAGLPAEKVVVKSNFIETDPGLGEQRGEHALFVGRLSQEKGINTLLAAWKRLGEKMHLKIVGDGPSAPMVAEAAKRFRSVEWLGRVPKDQVVALMKDAQILLLPSECYENCPVVVGEAYAVGLPVVASDLGSMTALIDHGRTGLRFRPGDSRDLAAQVEWAIAHPSELERMRGEARAEYEAKYKAEENYRRLMKIYDVATKQSI